mmetsp:Transcript_95157/g.142542  ORF Transcript_95157/g.142542 Transcript_95157/m.142542 type:complete len:187 (-) Transcript_95157:54-614(-)
MMTMSISGERARALLSWSAVVKGVRVRHHDPPASSSHALRQQATRPNHGACIPYSSQARCCLDQTLPLLRLTQTQWAPSQQQGGGGAGDGADGEDESWRERERLWQELREARALASRLCEHVWCLSEEVGEAAGALRQLTEETEQEKGEWWRKERGTMEEIDRELAESRAREEAMQRSLEVEQERE